MKDRSKGHETYDFDVIIVGSGVGGGTFADYFTRDNKALKVAILESGPYRDRSFFNQKELDMTGLYFDKGSVLSSNMQIGVAAANTVGGSSAVYTGVSFRPPESVLETWRKTFGLHFLSREYVEESLDEIEADIHVHELPRSMDNQNNSLFEKGAIACGIKVKRLRINIKDCQEQGFCNLGCTSGAKQGTLELQIPRVMERGVKLLANTTVTSIAENTVNCLIKDAPEGTISNEYPSGKHTFSARYIVLAAGVLHTPAILLRSLKNLSIPKKNLGRYLCLHPAFNINAVYKEEIKNYRGFPKSFYSDQFSESMGFYLETSFYYPGITAKNIPGYGKEHQEIMKAYAKMMSILILMHDKAESKNRISIDKNGNPIIHYSIADETKINLAKALQIAVKIFFEAGCTKAIIPGSSKMPLLSSDKDRLEELIQAKNLNFYKTPLSSAHPQGGARMAEDPSMGVCDTEGRVYGSSSIYVCDASLFPTSVEVNPYETIMLLAKHVAEGLKKKTSNFEA
jgi:choline dehydrogenase-like flavoprotein